MKHLFEFCAEKIESAHCRTVVEKRPDLGGGSVPIREMQLGCGFPTKVRNLLCTWPRSCLELSILYIALQHDERDTLCVGDCQR